MKIKTNIVHYDTDLDRMVTYNQLDMVIPIKEVLT